MKLLIALVALVGVAVIAAPAEPQPIVNAKKLFCGLCKDLVEEAESSGEQDVEAWLEKKVEEECKHLSILDSECVKELDKVITELANEINSKAPPEVCCEKVKLC